MLTTFDKDGRMVLHVVVVVVVDGVGRPSAEEDNTRGAHRISQDQRQIGKATMNTSTTKGKRCTVIENKRNERERKTKNDGSDHLLAFSNTVDIRLSSSRATERLQSERRLLAHLERLHRQPSPVVPGSETP